MNRRLFYFSAYFLVTFGVGFFLSFGIRLTNIPLFFASSQLLPPILTLLFSYLYFRKSKNDWSDRFITVLSWTVGFVILTTVLAQPVYGYPWSQMLTLDVLMGYWMIPAGILVAGIIAPRTPFTNPR